MARITPRRTCFYPALLRAKIKETIVNVSKKTGIPSLLEAEFVILANDEFHKISDMVKEEVGNLDSCHQIGQSLNYETISQMYDGALCCKT